MRLSHGPIAAGVFPRDPLFAEKASPILDLYEGRWRRKRLSENEFVISADEKPSIQCRRRKYTTTPPAPGRAMRVEHEYFCEGAWTYLAAWDVHRAKVFGCCVPKGCDSNGGTTLAPHGTTSPGSRQREVSWGKSRTEKIKNVIKRGLTFRENISYRNLGALAYSRCPELVPESHVRG